MTKTLSFNELRGVKDSLPTGSMQTIADGLGISADTVRNYFGGTHYSTGDVAGIHVGPGPDGGVVVLDDTTIYDMAMDIINEQN